MGDARTVKVRIAVVMMPNGKYYAMGYRDMERGQDPHDECLEFGGLYDEEGPPTFAWIDADVPVNAIPTIPATVTKAEEGE